MKKIYHLGTCSTCVRIIKELGLKERGFDFQDIKTEPLTAEQLEAIKEAVGSYEALFSRKAMKFRSMGLKDKVLSEEDYKKLILDEYTFLKRPVIVIGDKHFVGNAKKTIEEAKEAL